MTWRDRKPVSVLGTVPTSEDDSGVVEISTKVNGHWPWVKQTFARPGLISLYNTHMGGVDVSDQRVSSYGRLMRGSVWYYKMFCYLIEVCISNAHILERKSPNHTTRTALDFEMWCLRVLGNVRWSDKVTNETVLTKLKTKNGS